MTYGEKFMAAFWETIKIIVIALLIIIPVRAYVVQPFFVSGASMEPTFNNGDYLIIDELSYHFRQPERGDVIVFKFPQDPEQFYLKRIIGLPGGFVLNEEGWNRQGFTFGNIRVRLGVDEYFVLGDNRSASSDSRRWGPLTRNLIVGRVLARALPLSKVGFILSPTKEYFSK